MQPDSAVLERHRPKGFRLDRAALLGRMPDELTDVELMWLWRRDCKALPRSGPLWNAASVVLSESLANGSLKAERIEAKSESRLKLRRPPPFSISNWAAPRPAQVVSTTNITKAVTWIKRTEALAWFRSLDARWSDDLDCLLRCWWPELTAAPATVAASSARRRYAKELLDDVATAYEQLRSWGKAYAAVAAANPGVTAAALKKARSDQSAAPRKSAAKKKKARPRLVLVSNGHS